MEQALKLAVKGGYDAGNHILNTSKEYNLESVALLNPLFWQALGKSLGWKLSPKTDECWGHDEWKNQWHRFLDALIEGKTPYQFFEQLLANK